MCGPLIDGNGNRQIAPSDIAITLAAAEEEEILSQIFTKKTETGL